MTVIYRTTVHDAGPLAEAFVSEGMFVTFGSNAPEALREFCYIVDINEVAAALAPGQQLTVDGRAFPITAVGEVAQRNLQNLGHVTVNIDGDSEPKMAGAIHIRCDGPAPEITIGSVLTIEAA
jgi:PTS system glucitol/sorbitol-specific IIA component